MRRSRRWRRSASGCSGRGSEPPRSGQMIPGARLRKGGGRRAGLRLWRMRKRQPRRRRKRRPMRSSGAGETRDALAVSSAAARLACAQRATPGGAESGEGGARDRGEAG